MCWHHSLILRYTSKNSHLSEQAHIVFSTYDGKFSYLSCYLYTRWNTTDLSAITDISISCLWLKLKLKQDSWVYSHPGHCSLGGNLQAPCPASPLGICLLSTFNELYPFIFYRHYTMAEYAFFTQKADRWRKDMASLWGNLNICPKLQWLKFLCHSQVELSSLNGLKVWGEGQKPCHDIVFLLVWVENAMGDDRHYGLSIVWADPSQVRAASMEEAVGKLIALPPAGPIGLMP